jgi:1-aminocyclopropane-1-carboxylate deaminase/D-cysteine desulfhydrase-like pyridoxal-dependent ACC family enzyme
VHAFVEQDSLVHFGTAMAARKLGLEPYLLLRNKVNTLEDTMEGNLMLSRMIGATIRVFTIGELHAKGYDQIMNDLADELRAQGKNPYLIPVGGSTFVVI